MVKKMFLPILATCNFVYWYLWQKTYGLPALWHATGFLHTAYVYVTYLMVLVLVGEIVLGKFGTSIAGLLTSAFDKAGVKLTLSPGVMAFFAIGAVFKVMRVVLQRALLIYGAYLMHTALVDTGLGWRLYNWQFAGGICMIFVAWIFFSRGSSD